MWRREEYKAIFTVLKASATVKNFTFERGIAVLKGQLPGSEPHLPVDLL